MKREDGEKVGKEFLRGSHGSGLTRLNVRYSLFISVDICHVIWLLRLLNILLMLSCILGVSPPKVETRNFTFPGSTVVRPGA